MSKSLKEAIKQDQRRRATYRYVPELQDFSGTLGELQCVVEKLVKEHGKHEVISFDAGHNNIEVILGYQG